MSSGTPLIRLAERLREPFHRNGKATRLHPASVWAEASGTAALALAPAWEKIRGLWLRYAWPVLSVVSVLGWSVLAGAILLWTAGQAFGWQEAKAAAIAAFVLFLIAIGFVLGRSSYGVILDLARTRVAVGDSAVGSIAVSNTSTRPLLPAALELPVGNATAVFHLPRMKPQQVHEDLFTIPTARRAVIVVGPVRSVRADPLHLLRRQVMWTEPEDLFVHPRTVALAGSAAGFIRDLEGMPTTDLSSADVSFHALRDYVPGDDRRHIHWKTTARTNKLMVRQFEETRRAHLAISLSINTDEYASEQEFEMAISAAASIGRQAIREQRELDVLTQKGPLRCETGRNLLDDMTRIVGAPMRRTAVDLARTLADTVPNASVVFFVVGSNVTPSQLRSAAASVPPGVRSLAVRLQVGAAPGRANIADLTVLTLGDLADLAIVLRKAAA
ncbi:DUF58 domain-containing protein [Pseudarthrobacter sp. H3Y2-7]|jgi:uncharacterized protein (DUF58 family)|uniref:DUF58 domain-containing protein n=1 Tax=Pseudarthrobacter TaxID=1742993 RepID=UPI0023AF59C4|nr:MULTISPECIES: DUF58 domain-containing protein [unclassified Pseudarthrobacter]MDE8667462.1 DUF58 domain-containing protein [Pseudarthrobacter sp. H3Y2-7]